MKAEQIKALVTHLTPFVTERRAAMFRRVSEQRTGRLAVILEGVEDPNDVCAVMRSCDCFGVQDLHLLSHAAPFKLSPGVAVGSSKWVSLRNHGLVRDKAERALLKILKSEGYRIALFSPDQNAVSIEDVPLEKKLALTFSDCRGGLASSAEVSVRIPTRGFGQQFNLSVNASLCLAVLRRRLLESSEPWQLSHENREALVLAWLGKMGKRMPLLIQNWLTAHGLSWSALPEIARSEIKPPLG